MQIVKDPDGTVTIIFKKPEAKDLATDLKELERHFDLDTFCDSDDDPIGRLILALSEAID